MSIFDEIQDAPYFSLCGMDCQSKIVGVHDGDTVNALIQCNDSIFKFRCRLARIDAPELKSTNEQEKKQAIHSRDMLSSLVLNQIVRLKIGKNDKFSRPLVDIYIPGANEESEENEEICVNDWLVTNNFARLYHGEKKKEWTF